MCFGSFFRSDLDSWSVVEISLFLCICQYFGPRVFDGGWTILVPLVVSWPIALTSKVLPPWSISSSCSNVFYSIWVRNWFEVLASSSRLFLRRPQKISLLRTIIHPRFSVAWWRESGWSADLSPPPFGKRQTPFLGYNISRLQWSTSSRSTLNLGMNSWRLSLSPCSREKRLVAFFFPLLLAKNSWQNICNISLKLTIDLLGSWWYHSLAYLVRVVMKTWYMIGSSALYIFVIVR